MQASKYYELFCKRRRNLHIVRYLRGFLMISLFFSDLSGYSSLASSISRYLEFSPGITSLSRSRAISKFALSRTFFPVPSEFEIARVVCNELKLKVVYKKNFLVTKTLAIFYFCFLAKVFPLSFAVNVCLKQEE